MPRSASAPALMLALLMVVPFGANERAAATEVDEPPPYNVRPFELVDLPFDRLPWTSDAPPALPALPPVDAQGIRLTRWRDGNLYYRPGAVAINGMKRIDAYRDTGDVAQLEHALVNARLLRSLRIERDDAWWLPFWFDYPQEGLSAPWFNAMSQGLVLAFFVRLHRVTGDDVHLRAAEKVFESFRRLGPTPPDDSRAWVAYADEDGYLWLEHYPNAEPDHVLNAHLHATIGLYEYWQHTRSPAARQVLEGALTTMKDRAQKYRREGRVSVYGLRSRTNHYKYHQVHIWQLRLLGRMTGDPFFTMVGDLMASDRRPKRNVPGRPAVSRTEPVPSTSPRVFVVGPYPPVSPALDRAA